jgi:hypothetical protein
MLCIAKNWVLVVYGHGQRRIWGGAMGSNGSDVTGSHMTGSDVSHVTGSDHVRKYILRMGNGSCAISALVGAFWPEVTKSRDRKRPCPEVSLIGSRFCACPDFSRAFFLVVVATWLPKVTWPPSGLSWVYATGSCATSVMTEDHVTPFGSVHGVFSTTSASYNPIFLYLVTRTSPGYLPLLFSYNV